MRRQRTFLVAAVIALAASFSVGFHTPLRDGPIPCLDGSTVDFGQFCPVLTVDCANGTKVPIGLFCPIGATQAKPTTLSELFTDMAAGLKRLQTRSQTLGPSQSSAGTKFVGANLQAVQTTFQHFNAEKAGMRVFFDEGTVAPSSFGVVDLLIPWGDLSDLLKPGVLQTVTS